MDEWDDYAANWDGEAAVQAYADGAFASLTALAESIGFDLTEARVCDFGCGTGLLTERLADRCSRIDAVDTSRAMLDELEAKVARQSWEHVRLLERLPPAPQRYDLIVCSSVLSFVPDYPAEVRALAAHLAPGGLFVQWDWELDPDADEPHGLTSAEIRLAIEHVGLESVAVGTGFEVAVGKDEMKPLMGSGRRPSDH